MLADVVAASPGTAHNIAISSADALEPSPARAMLPTVVNEVTVQGDSQGVGNKHGRIRDLFETWKKRSKNGAVSLGRLGFGKKERAPVKGIFMGTVANNGAGEE